LIKDSEKYNEFIRFMVYWLKNKQEICYELLHRHAQALAEKQTFTVKVENAPAREVKNNKEGDSDDDDDEQNKKNILESNLNFKVSYDDFKLSKH
jgi:hypothetical protein